MKKLLYALTLFLAGCISIPNKKSKINLPQNINLVPLEQLVFFNEQEYRLPNQLESFIDLRLYLNRIKDRKGFEADVYKLAENLGYSRQQIRELEPLEAILLAANIVAEKLEFYKTFKDENTDEYGIRYTDEEFRKGKTHCGFYARATSAIFDLFKKENPKLKNIYMTDHFLHDANFIYDWESVFEKVEKEKPKNLDEYYLALLKYAPKDLVYQAFHEWNAIFVYSPSSLQIAMTDPTFYDSSNRKKLDALDSNHINLENQEWKSRLLKQLEKFDVAYKSILITQEKSF